MRWDRTRCGGISWIIALGLVLGPGCGESTPGATPKPRRFPWSSTLANRCDDLTVEKQWVRSYLDEIYLWDLDVPDLDAGVYATPEAYFDALLVRTPTASGRPRDRFSTTFPAAELENPDPLWYGIRWVVGQGGLQVAYVQPGSPAAEASVQRGDQLVAINGQDPNAMDPQLANQAVYPVSRDESFDFTFATNGGGTKVVTLHPATFDDPGVFLDRVLDRPGGGKVGYVVFNSQLGNPFLDMQAAVQRLADAGVSDVVLDVRYNPGGVISVVSSVGTFLGGSHVDGKIFAYDVGNDKAQQARVEAGLAPEIVFPFNTVAVTLDLPRLYVLTTEMTCSGSETLINGLAPFVDVRRIGSTTCGMPYGYYPQENCGTYYLALDYRDTNARHDPDFVDGFAPDCDAEDDFSHALGDPTEGMLATALAYLETGQCPPAQRASPSRLSAPERSTVPRPWVQPRYQAFRSSSTSLDPYSRARFSPK